MSVYFSVVIPVRTESEVRLLQRCIETLNNYHPYIISMIELFLVDYGTSNLSGLLNQRIQFPGKRIYSLPGANINQAYNLGMKNSTGMIVFLLENDIYFIEPTLQILANLIQMAGFGVVAPLVLYPDRTIERAGVTYINLKDNEPGWIVPHFRYQNFLNPNAVSLTSCNVAEKCIGISQQVIKKVGYLREDLSYLYACVDYCLKARTNGSSTFHVGYTSVISDLPQWLNICEKYQPTHILELAEIEEKDRKILYDCWNGIKI